MNRDIKTKLFNIEQLESAIKNHKLSYSNEINHGLSLALTIAKNMLEKPEPLFQKGDIVHVLSFGIDSEFGVSREGIVEDVNSDFSVDVRLSYPTCIEVHPEKNISFAKFSVHDGGFSQDRPKKQPKIGDWGWFDNGIEDKYIYAQLGEVTNKGFIPKDCNILYMAFHLQNPIQ